MLKALELAGFKSFATKTRFLFPPGITVVVGPNGSGKSNIVDAIKWALGEQSVKSLRGSEMVDVIFNGSGTRRSMNSAEITLTFDNSKGLLAVDSDEVHITRRVYRSGEGEYLINRQPCRLRDIRELLAGTGMGTHAYSIIEQGKVDVLLQSSPRERRAIFEEAAGISRFKSKKVEAARRLERVEQNLLRLSDIVDEVDNRLRSVRSQAGKARRYREYSDRLQELRTQVGLVDWQRLSQRLAECEEQAQRLQAERTAVIAEADGLETRLRAIEASTAAAAESLHAVEARLAHHRERIAGQESTIDHHRALGRELDAEVTAQRERVLWLNSRADEFEELIRATAAELAQAEAAHGELAGRFAEGERLFTDLVARVDRVRLDRQSQRAAVMESMRAVATVESRITSLERELANSAAAQTKNAERLRALDDERQGLAQRLEELKRQHLAAQERSEDAAQRAAEAQDLVAQRRRQYAARQADAARLAQRYSGMKERAAVLEELERRHEGLSPGVRAILDQARAAPEGPYGAVRGVVADLLRVSVESAALIEVALGETAQYLVAARDERLVDQIERDSLGLAGRVGFIWLGFSKGGQAEVTPADLSGQPGVLGRADCFVETEADFLPLATHLLARTWIVEKLGQARLLAEGDGRGCHFVTLSGEHLSADGCLLVGPRHISSGLISRRSELRALRGELETTAQTIEQAETALAELGEQVTRDEAAAVERASQHRQALDAAAACQHEVTSVERHHAEVDRQYGATHAESENLVVQSTAAQAALAAAKAEQLALEVSLAELERQLSESGQTLERLEAEREVRGRENTESEVALGKSDERLTNLDARRRQLEESQQERLRMMADTREQLAQTVRRGEEAWRAVLRSESEVALLYVLKQRDGGQRAQLAEQLDALQAERSGLAGEAERRRNESRTLDDAIQSAQLAAGKVRLERTALAERLREDYGIELEALERDSSDEEQAQRQSVQDEIDELRRKINHLGNVNLEALGELDEIESRYQTLAGQYKDLVDAKTALERIIEKINVDSRRLFGDTLMTVKEHFGALFRDLFGGGQADIVLEENVDLLESGIEIVARPPGKEPRSISLLSGGEKTLTCVALLLAIFRSRPSPFCVLDEVDAALDEANIDRFTKVLQGFLDWTQFIIVTHSKKTMTAANTIYGVTMQESGVSKQVSVRFEDVSETGEILIPVPEDDVAEEDVGEDGMAAGDETQAA